MITIGIRVQPDKITYVVYDSGDDRIINIDEIIVPAAFSVPDSLKYIRSNILDILREYNVNRAGIRTTESSSQNKCIKRIEIEGVIQESFASSTLDSYYVGCISSIMSRLGQNRTDFKQMIDGEKNPNIESWDKMTKESREAFLCAKGAINA